MTPLQQKISETARASQIARYSWHGRGQAPLGYTVGMACAYAEVYRLWKANDPNALAMTIPLGSPGKDALAWYDEQIDAVPAVRAAPMLRQLFVLMLGLGMRESSGQFCCGRDMDAGNVHGYDTEAGLFQTSYNIGEIVPRVWKLFEQATQADGNGGLLPIFREGVHCSESDLKNWGSGPGVLFQEFEKMRPLFAVMVAAMGLRGARGHWGPIINRAAEIKAEAEALFHAVETLVDEAGPAAQPPAEAPPVAQEPPPATPVAAPLLDPIQRGAVGEWVTVLQTALRKEGATIKADGDFGPLTEEAVRTFQRTSGLADTGIADDATMVKLLRLAL